MTVFKKDKKKKKDHVLLYFEKLFSEMGNNRNDWKDFLRIKTNGQYDLLSDSKGFNVNKMNKFKCNVCNHKFTMSVKEFVLGKRCPNCYPSDEYIKPLTEVYDPMTGAFISNLIKKDMKLNGEFCGIQYDIKLEHLFEDSDGEIHSHEFKTNLMKIGGFENLECPVCENSGTINQNISSVLMGNNLKLSPKEVKTDVVTLPDKQKEIFSLINKAKEMGDLEEKLNSEIVEEDKKDDDKMKEENTNAKKEIKLSPDEEALSEVIDELFSTDKRMFQIMSDWGKLATDGLKVLDINLEEKKFKTECNDCGNVYYLKELDIRRDSHKCTVCEKNYRELKDGTNLFISSSIDNGVRIISKEGNLLTLKRNKVTWTQTMESIIMYGFTK